MFVIQDGRKEFYQWDLDRKLIVSDGSIKEVHFCNKTDSCSLIRETYIEEGQCLVDVPNVLLQNDWRINVYAYGDNYTKYSTCFKVVSRTKPADYVYTDEELKTWEELEQRVEALEQGGNSGPAVKVVNFAYDASYYDEDKGEYHQYIADMDYQELLDGLYAGTVFIGRWHNQCFDDIRADFIKTGGGELICGPLVPMGGYEWYEADVG